MKVRSGFVANSSSSSYVCEVCNRIEAGWDMCLSDAEMMECEAGHTFCTDEVVGDSSITPKDYAIKYLDEMLSYSWIDDERKKQIKELLLKCISVDEKDWAEFYSDENISEFLESDNYGVPSCFCPICTLSSITESMKMEYLLKKNGLKTAELAQEIQENFETYEEFTNYMK